MDDASRFPPDDPREWLNRARSNLRLAARLDDAYLDDLCWQALEAAEKAIKAVMIARGVRYPYLHDLETLLERLEAAGCPAPPEILRAAKAASHPPEERYPLEDAVSEPRYTETLEAARELVRWAEREVSDARRGRGKLRELPVPYEYDARSAGGGSPEPTLLADVVGRVVAAVRPQRIILFGSAARGTMGPNSDLDLLVVMPPRRPFDRGRLHAAIGASLRGLPVPVDVVLATPAILRRYGRSWCLVYCPALEEGRVIYEREGCSAAAVGGAPGAESLSVAQTGR